MARKWDLNLAVSIFSVSKVCVGSWTTLLECIDLSGQFFPPTFLSHLVRVLCMCGRELNSGMA